MPSLLMLCVVAALTALAVVSFRHVPEGQVHTFRRIGGHTRVLGSGRHLVLPLIDRATHRFNLTGNSLAFESESVDGERIGGTLHYQVLEPERADAVIDHIGELMRARLDVVLAGGSLPRDLTERRQWLKQAVNSDLRTCGLIVTRVDFFSPVDLAKAA
ncbi:MAG: hypothetical protein WBP11_04990 [Dokdonella sp.]